MNGLRFNRTSDRLELQISEDSDRKLFDEIAHVLQRQFRGSWSEKVDGPDQRYWDLKIGNVTLTLHLEHYLGIMLFSSSEESDKGASDVLLEQTHEFLTSYEPAA